jgi:hypothetical protein
MGEAVCQMHPVTMTWGHTPWVLTCLYRGATTAGPWAAELYRLKGASLVQLLIVDVSQVEASLQYALNVARRQQRKNSWLTICGGLR